MPLQAEESTDGAKSNYRSMGNESLVFQDTVNLGVACYAADSYARLLLLWDCM